MLIAFRDAGCFVFADSRSVKLHDRHASPAKMR